MPNPIGVVSRHTNGSSKAPRISVSAMAADMQVSIMFDDGHEETVFTGPQFDQAGAEAYESEHPNTWVEAHRGLAG